MNKKKKIFAPSKDRSKNLLISRRKRNKSQKYADEYYCEKVKFNTKDEAESELKNLKIASSRRENFKKGAVKKYYCNNCLGWHLASNKKSNLRKRKGILRNHRYV